MSRFYVQTEEGHWHWCPGCKETHRIPSKRGWSFDGNAECPTFTPSVNISWGNAPGAQRCHYFIQQGKILFCDDSTHALKGQTVPLPELPAEEREFFSDTPA